MHLPSLANYRHIVVLTGAGISAESGIKTFRDAGGLWENHRIEDVATPAAFARDPHLVWRFYSMRRQAAAQAKPNLAHLALDAYAAHHQGQLTLVTQNVDTLHERARSIGQLDPLCMHGSLEKSRCSDCGMVYLDDMAWLPENEETKAYSTELLSKSDKSAEHSITQFTLKFADGLPLSPCCGTLLRPHIVWFGEMPLYMDRIWHELADCDLFISIGTSGVVYPAAGFIEVAKEHGAETICVNLEPLPQSAKIDHFIQGSAGTIVPQLFKR